MGQFLDSLVQNLTYFWKNMLNFSSGNLPFGFLNQLQFTALIHESFQKVSLNYQCMTARGGFSAEMETWLVYLGEHSCHNFYWAHIFCGLFCLFFLFSGRINEKIFLKKREDKKKTLLDGPGKVIKGFKSPLSGGADILSFSTGDSAEYMMCSVSRKGRKGFILMLHHHPLRTPDQQALFQLAVK